MWANTNSVDCYNKDPKVSLDPFHVESWKAEVLSAKHMKVFTVCINAILLNDDYLIIYIQGRYTLQPSSTYQS